MDKQQLPVFLFDGDCAFCSSCAEFIERRIRVDAKVMPWQFADLGQLGLTQEEAEYAVQWVDTDGSIAAGPVGIGVLLQKAQWYWKPIGWMLRKPPVRWLAWPIYRLISRNRHRMPGGTATCSLPQARRQ